MNARTMICVRSIAYPALDVISKIKKNDIREVVRLLDSLGTVSKSVSSSASWSQVFSESRCRRHQTVKSSSIALNQKLR